MERPRIRTHSPLAEAILGFLLLVGFYTSPALLGGSLLMLVLTFGSTLRQDWSTAGVQLMYAAVYAALMAFHGWNDYSLDWLLSRSQMGQKQR